MKKIILVLIIIIAAGCTNLQAQRLMKPKSHAKSHTHHVDRRQKVKGSKKSSKDTHHVKKTVFAVAVYDTVKSVRCQSNMEQIKKATNTLKNSYKKGILYDKNCPIHFNNYVMCLHNNETMENEGEVTSKQSTSDTTIYSLYTLDAFYEKMFRAADMSCVLMQNDSIAIELRKKVKSICLNNQKVINNADTNSYRASDDDAVPYR